MDPELLSRVQVAFTASFQFIFPPLSMGLGTMLVIMGIVYVRTKDPKWRQLSFFWVKIYGIVFAMGVATGVVQEFEFGMNWADYSRFVGNVFGSLLAAEGVFAFFLEGGFLGLMLFAATALAPGCGCSRSSWWSLFAISRATVAARAGFTQMAFTVPDIEAEVAELRGVVPGPRRQRAGGAGVDRTGLNGWRTCTDLRGCLRRPALTLSAPATLQRRCAAGVPRRTGSRRWRSR